MEVVVIYYIKLIKGFLVSKGQKWEFSIDFNSRPFIRLCDMTGSVILEFKKLNNSRCM